MLRLKTGTNVKLRFAIELRWLAAEGNVSFISKTQLINHYTETLGAFHAGGRVMIIETVAALRLMNKYFKNIEL